MTKGAPDSGLVCVVDDDAAVREALASLLRACGFRVETFDSAEAFTQRRGEEVPTCVLLDVRMPGMSGLELQRQLAQRREPVGIVFITAHGDIPMAVEAVKAGAIEFLVKPFDDRQLAAAVQAALQASAAARRQRDATADLRRRLRTLTPREREIAELIVAGLRNKQVAARLNISEITVKVHRHNVMAKMGANSLAQLVAAFERLRDEPGRAD
jgi:FixJ family two-component response regulator